MRFETWCNVSVGIVRVAALCIGILSLPSAQDKETILGQTGVVGGLCAHVGAPDGALATELASGGALVVHVLAANDQVRDAARALVQSRGLYGTVSVDKCKSFTALPYFDNLLTLLIADLDNLASSGLTRTEALRAVAPGGVAYLKTGGLWQPYRKEYPAGYGEWSQWDGGPDGGQYSNDEILRPVNSLQWLADFESYDIGKSLAEGAGMRIWKNWVASISVPQSRLNDSMIVKCRDAFSGNLLWKKHISLGLKQSFSPKGRGFALGDGKLFMVMEQGGPVVGIDLATGNVVNRYTNGLRFSAASGGLVYLLVTYNSGCVIAAYGKELVVVDSKSGDVKWKRSDGPYTYACFADGKMYCTKGSYGEMGRQNSLGAATRYCIEVVSGREVWSAAGPGNLSSFGHYKGNLVEFYENYACCGPTGGSIGVVDAATGKRRWGSGYGKESYDGDIGTGLACGSNVFVAGPSKMTKYDIQTGAASLVSAKAGHGACRRGSSTPNYLITNGSYFWDQNMNVTKIHLSRGGCGISTFPANGMLYAPPTTCGCWQMIKGYNAAKARALPASLAESERLEKYAPPPGVVAPGTPWPKSNEWPLFRGDIRRSCYTASALGTGMRLLWQKKVSSPGNGLAWEDFTMNNKFSRTLTPATVADGRVYLAAPHRHQIVALNANTGAESWRFTAGGRIDSPPTIYGGLCIFGCNDGWVYCLEAASGKLIWRRLVARNHERMAAFGQPESDCPVSGSVVVFDGFVYAVGGRHIDTDGGFRVNKISPFTGELVWADTIAGSRLKSGVKLSPVIPLLNMIAYDGKVLMMDNLVIHPTFNQIVQTYYYIDVHNPPEHLWARFTDPSWSHTEWELGRSISGNFLNQTGGRNGSTGMSYGTVRSRKQSSGGFLVRTPQHLYGLDKRAIVRTPLDSTGNPVAKLTYTQGADPAVEWVYDLGAAFPNVTTSPSVRAAAIAGKSICILSGEMTRSDKTTEPSQLVVVTQGSTSAPKFALPSTPEWNGIAIAYGKVFVSTEDGSVSCFGNESSIPIAVKRTLSPGALDAPSFVQISMQGVQRVSNLGVASPLAPVAISENKKIAQLSSLGIGRTVSLPSTKSTRMSPQPQWPDLHAIKGILREHWDTDSSIDSPPSVREYLRAFSAPPGHGDNYRARIRGYIIPPSSGSYTFWISADDAADLFLSVDEDPSGKALIASIHMPTGARNWDAAAAQRSRPIALQAGKRYYVEVLHTETTGDDHVDVAWEGPGIDRTTIDGQHLAPWTMGCGGVFTEYWPSISGERLSDLTENAAFPYTPAGIEVLSSLRATFDRADNYGQRIRGFIHAPSSGEYRFWIAADETAEFRIALDGSGNVDGATDNLETIASVPSPVGRDQFDVHESQQSRPVVLISGKRYYFEIVHKEATGPDNCSVAWKFGNSERVVVSGAFLSPYTGR